MCFSHLRLICKQKSKQQKNGLVLQVSLLIRGRYVPSFWTANLEFASKKSIFDWKSVI